MVMMLRVGRHRTRTTTSASAMRPVATMIATGGAGWTLTSVSQASTAAPHGVWWARVPRFGQPPLGEHQPGLAVDELAGGVEVAGVGRSLDGHVEDRGAVDATRRARLGPPARLGVEGRGGDDRVGAGDLVAVEGEDLLHGRLGRDLPGGFGQLDALAGDDRAEPEALDVEGEVLDEPQR